MFHQVTNCLCTFIVETLQCITSVFLSCSYHQVLHSQGSTLKLSTIFFVLNVHQIPVPKVTNSAKILPSQMPKIPIFFLLITAAATTTILTNIHPIVVTIPIPIPIPCRIVAIIAWSTGQRQHKQFMPNSTV